MLARSKPRDAAKLKDDEMKSESPYLIDVDLDKRRMTFHIRSVNVE